MLKKQDCRELVYTGSCIDYTYVMASSKGFEYRLIYSASDVASTEGILLTSPG